jgi:O-antigen/teichoic acid export membrane protein
MFDKIKHLGTETAIYGVSTIVGRFLNFLLVPFYTNVLPPSDYGIVSYVFSLIAFMNVIYGYGMESAYFRYSSSKEIGTTEQNFSTPFISLFVTSAAFSGMLLLLSPIIVTAIAIPSQHKSIVDYASWILFFDTLAIMPFASLRMEHKAKMFASLKSLNIVINVGANLVLLLVFKMGVEGIFTSNLLASATTLFFLVPTIRRHFTTNFSTELYRALLKFGLPYIPAGLATMMIQVVDRPIMRMLTDDATVGIYQANYRLGIFMMLVVQMYDYAWRPFFLSHASESKAKQMFARILTYFVAFTSIVFLLLTFFLPDLVRINIFGRYVIHPDYWGALGIVPIVLLGYVFLGIYNNLVAGIYIEKKTHFLPTITFVGAAVNVIGNFLLIPKIGAYGAAWATFLSYAVMAAVLYVMVQRVYLVQYEWSRLGKIAAACGIVVGVYYLIPITGYHLLWKFGLMVAYCFAIYFMKFFNTEEISIIRSLMTKTPSTLETADSSTSD